jgi:ACS family hexuronate transporter-like MFS transporter
MTDLHFGGHQATFNRDYCQKGGRMSINVTHRGQVARQIGRAALLFIAHAIGTANITLVIVLSPAIEASLALGNAGFGFIISAYYAAMLVLALPVGWLADRYGLKIVLVIAHSLLAIGLWVLTFASGLMLATLALALCGCGYAFINPATARAVLMWFPARERATVMGVKQTGVPAGGVIAAFIAATVDADWRKVVLVMAVVTAVVGVGYLGLRVAQTPRFSPVRFLDMRRLFVLPHLAYFNAGSWVYCAGQTAFFAYIVLFIHHTMEATITLITLCLVITHLASAAGRVLWGLVSDRLIPNSRIGCLLVIGVSAAFGIALLMSAAELGSVGIVTATALIGFTLGGYAGLTQTAAVEAVDPDWAGAAIGYNMLFTSFGAMVGPVVFGFAVEWIGYAATWSILAWLLLVGVLLFWMSKTIAPVDQIQ